MTHNKLHSRCILITRQLDPDLLYAPRVMHMQQAMGRSTAYCLPYVWMLGKRLRTCNDKPLKFATHVVTPLPWYVGNNHHYCLLYRIA
jgi:hypothetical protein